MLSGSELDLGGYLDGVWFPLIEGRRLSSCCTNPIAGRRVNGTTSDLGKS
jgi:hypothetical protein